MVFNTCIRRACTRNYFTVSKSVELNKWTVSTHEEPQPQLSFLQAPCSLVETESI